MGKIPKIGKVRTNWEVTKKLERLKKMIQKIQKTWKVREKNKKQKQTGRYEKIGMIQNNREDIKIEQIPKHREDTKIEKIPKKSGRYLKFVEILKKIVKIRKKGGYDKIGM